MNANSIRNESDASKIIDGLRFFAAFSVMIMHMDVFNSRTNMIYSIMHAWQNLGYQFVMVFFVLSGLFISSSVLKSIETGTWSWKLYLTNRLTRLWVVLVPALVLTAFWDWIEAFLVGVKPFDLSLQHFAENLFFLQGIRGIIWYGSNGPLWSLSYEFWYYILFPVLILTIRSREKRKKVLYGVITLGLVALMWGRILEYFPIWLCGSGVVLIPWKNINNKLTSWITMTSSTIIALASFKLLYHVLGIPSPTVIHTSYIADLSVGVAWGLFAYTTASIFNHRTIFKPTWPTYLAGFSYTLYLTHYPPLIFILELYAKHNQYPTPKDFPILVLLLVAYAWLVSRFTEAKTSAVRNWARRRMATISSLSRSIHKPKFEINN